MRSYKERGKKQTKQPQREMFTSGTQKNEKNNKQP